MYIYKIVNIITNKIYIGQTIQKNPKMRWYGHCASANSGAQSYLHRSIRKHGVDKFTFEVVDQAASIEQLNLLEGHWVDHIKSQGFKVYNLRETGGNKLHSPESIERMRESQKAAHARRREQNGGVETINKKSGYTFSKPHPKKGKPSTKWNDEQKAKHKIKMKEVMQQRFKKEIT